MVVEVVGMDWVHIPPPHVLAGPETRSATGRQDCKYRAVSGGKQFDKG